jgi:hypothetical protein
VVIRLFSFLAGFLSEQKSYAMKRQPFSIYYEKFRLRQTISPPIAASSLAPDRQFLEATTPPMGWNSWDGYGTTIKEAEFEANAQWFAKHLKPYGWQ